MAVCNTLFGTTCGDYLQLSWLYKRAGFFTSKLRNHRRCHLTTGLSTTTTGCSTAFAVFVVVFLALSRTAIASFGADTTHLTVDVGVTGHETGAEVASVCTVPA